MLWLDYMDKLSRELKYLRACVRLAKREGNEVKATALGKEADDLDRRIKMFKGWSKNKPATDT